ncbi:MAG: RpiB/LacA/LacB family sugar-phosphate isomerase [Armatimonadetes bacterium]|nr:RpiB/LacA/LacB family sugar-phosphate isomerase [Armatimonadota bacterium]
MKLAFSSDHAGFEFRQALADWARSQGHQVDEYGAKSHSSFDYPVAADEAVASILAGSHDLGVFICGSGIGISIRANRYPGIRCALCCGVESARLARLHNNANAIALGARMMSAEDGIAILAEFLSTEPDPDERHARRVRQLDSPLSS